MREIPIRQQIQNWQMDQHVFIIPRSADPLDYGVITTLDDDELLRRGLKGEINFHGFGPDTQAAEREIKQYLRGLIRTKLGYRNRKRKRIKLGLLPVWLLLVITPLIGDGFLVGVIMVALLLFFHKAQQQELLNQQRIAVRIDQVRIQENPLLSAAFASFRSLDTAAGTEPHLVDFSRSATDMKQDERALTVEVIRRYLDLHGAGPLQRAIRRADRDVQYAQGVGAVVTRIRRAYLRLKVSVGGGDPGRTLEPASLAIYEDLLDKARAAERSRHRQREWDIVEPGPLPSNQPDVNMPHVDWGEEGGQPDPLRQSRRDIEQG